MVENNNEGSYSDTIKYNIYIKFSIAGIAEKSDIIGAIFGQTEGLLGDSLDLRDLQRTNRIGRITVNNQYNKSQRKTTGTIIVPSSLDRIETGILAASLETVDRVGPCLAKIQLQKIEDVRSTKRDQIIERATQILKSWDQEVSPESHSLVEEVVKKARISSISKWGPEKLPAGPGIKDSDTLILVEGRADVLNLIKFGFRNVLAVQGTNIPASVIPLTRQKRTIAFLDGDRGGDLILRELLELAELDFVARAPPKMEVEELSGKEVLKALRNRIPIEQVLKDIEIDRSVEKKEKSRFTKFFKRDKVKKEKKEPLSSKNKIISKPKILKPTITKLEPPNIPDSLQTLINSTEEFEGVILDKNNKIIQRTAVKNLQISLVDEIKDKAVNGIIFDGIITQRIVDVAKEGNLEYLIGVKSGKINKPESLKIYEFKRNDLSS